MTDRVQNLLVPSLSVAARSHVGVERTENEDRLLVADLEAGRAHDGAFDGQLGAGTGSVLLAVCDGMGGEAGGEVASSTAVAALYRSGLARLPGRSESEASRGLLEAVSDASREIERLASSTRGLDRMGTTATACTLAGDSLVVAQVGDSRAYLLRGGLLFQLTRDQTLKTMLLEQGRLSPDEAKDFALGHVILQALGRKGGVDVDLGWVRLCRDDVLLLCSDGLFGCVPHETITDILAANGEPAVACDRLIQAALDHGAPDNVTCIVAHCGGPLPSEGDGAPVLRKVLLA